jgi:hypothetical protein
MNTRPVCPECKSADDVAQTVEHLPTTKHPNPARVWWCFCCLRVVR